MNLCFNSSNSKFQLYFLKKHKTLRYRFYVAIEKNVISGRPEEVVKNLNF